MSPPKPPFVGIAALASGCQTIARHLVFFLVSASAADLFARGLLQLQPPIPARPEVQDLKSAAPVVLFVLLVGTLTGVAYINVALACSTNRAPAFADLWPGGRSILRFARASVSYGFMTFLLYLAASFAGGTGYAEYVVFTKGGPVSIGLAAFGAAALAVGFLVGRWLVDRQFFGHLIIDRQLGGNAAFRASVPMARSVRWSLLSVIIVPLAIATALGAVRVMFTDIPNVPRPLGIPRVGQDWPPAVVIAVDAALVVLQTLAAWLGVLALTFVYRAAQRWLATASSATEGGEVI